MYVHAPIHDKQKVMRWRSEFSLEHVLPLKCESWSLPRTVWFDSKSLELVVPHASWLVLSILHRVVFGFGFSEYSLYFPLSMTSQASYRCACNWTYNCRWNCSVCINSIPINTRSHICKSHIHCVHICNRVTGARDNVL